MKIGVTSASFRCTGKVFSIMRLLIINVRCVLMTDAASFSAQAEMLEGPSGLLVSSLFNCCRHCFSVIGRNENDLSVEVVIFTTAIPKE